MVDTDSKGGAWTAVRAKSLFVVGTITVSWLRGFLSQCLTVLVAGFYGFICSAVVAVKWYVMGLFRS